MAEPQPLTWNQATIGAAWPLCIEHGRMIFRVNEPGSSYYECMGFDGEGCRQMITLAALEAWWAANGPVPPGIDIAWWGTRIRTAPVIELGERDG